ncbi:MAG: DUF262 domain-containing HNH endonuclease family protein [Chitinispirillales bacterium]|jgi:uncharacterized protein with ParB-like and HNH nuclease domain|nr:DUF262 domain-containing HNH endonuclease family protein [Chitinispirillales bacterium]
MNANETKVERFLETTKVQFVIPVYQRNYDWKKIQCERLLDDILEVGSNDNLKVHFIGSIVYVHDDAYTTAKINELIIIDGQQRLTTITLIYLALYHLVKSMEEKSLADEIMETYLINKFAEESEKLKLRPTDNNDYALKCLLKDSNHADFESYSTLIANFDLFKKRITKENYQTIRQGLAKLMFVEISLDRSNDDPQRIFESLNSTGLDLSQADLIRNYILMGLSRIDQSKIYQNYWEVIEKFAKDETTNESKVSEFIRDFLTLETKNIPNKGSVYIKFKEKYPNLISSMDELERLLLRIKKLAMHYNKLLNPKKEPDKEIQKQLEYIAQLEINVAYPFLMQVYDDFNNNVIDKSTFISILNLVQSLTWRRFIVGLPTNALNKMFMSLYDKVDKNDYLFSVQKSLLQRSSTQRFPNNTEISNALKEKDVYNIKHKNTMYFLERLENYQNPEYVKIEDCVNITIEHIFPQNPDPKWRMELGIDQCDKIKEFYLNTIGNLTLSGNNGKLGNKSFSEKRNMNVDGKEQGYSYSRFWLNKSLREKTEWNLHEIKERTKMITERFMKIWEYPDIQIKSEDGNGEVNIFEIDDQSDKQLEYYVFCDQRTEVLTTSQLFCNIFKQLFDLQPESFFNTPIKDRINLSNKIEVYENKAYEQLNDTYFMCTNYTNAEKIDRIKEALSILKLEDELFIKYAENESNVYVV